MRPATSTAPAGLAPSRYFGVGTLRPDEEQATRLRESLQRLRERLIWDQAASDVLLHAAAAAPPVRRQVLDLIGSHAGRFDATFLDKQAVGQRRDVDLYGLAWQAHVSRLIGELSEPGDDLMVVAASLGTRRKRSAFRTAVESALRKHGDGVGRLRLVYWPATSDLCLAAADYCLWAVGRARERDDAVYRTLVQQLIATDQVIGQVERRNDDTPAD